LHGPLYAIQVILSDLGTCGGVRADGFGRALTGDGVPISGLYAIGNTTANAYGHAYPGAGATIGQGLVSGYAAALHAAGRPPPHVVRERPSAGEKAMDGVRAGTGWTDRAGR
jgi:predicted oxidoreductase